MRKLALSIALATGMVAAPSAAALAQTDDGTVTVVHGVPDLTVDVYVNGAATLTDFASDTVTDPLTLPAGDYDLAVRPAGADATSDPAIAGSATLPAGANASIAAHLDADGAPTLGVFVNDTSPIAAGEARLTVRHTAAAPAVDVRADGNVIFSGVANGAEGTVDVPAGTYSADVVLAGTDTVALGPADLTLAEGTNTIVYAVGSAADGNLHLLTQTISGLQSAPTGVPAGSGGLAATPGVPVWLVAAMLAGLGLLLVPARTVVARRRVR